MNQQQIAVVGETSLLKVAPIEQLSGQLRSLLQKTTVSSCTLRVVRRLPPRKGPGTTIQHAIEGGVQIQVQGDTPGRENYRCVLTSETHSGQDLRKELADVAPQVAGVLVQEGSTLSTTPKRPTKPKVDKKQFCHLTSHPEKLRSVLESIRNHSDQEGQIKARSLVNGIARDFGHRGSKQGLSAVILALRRTGYIQVLDDSVKPKDKFYVFTDKANALLGGKMLPVSKVYKVTTRTASPPVPAGSELQQQLAELERQETQYSTLLTEIEEGKTRLEAQTVEAGGLKQSIERLTQIRQLLKGPA